MLLLHEKVYTILICNKEKAVAEVVAIFIAPSKGTPMVGVEQVQAIMGLGLEGDRYALQCGSWMSKGETTHKPKRNVTLIAIEGIFAANALLSFEAQFTLEETRRNIVTRGVNVNALVGRVFKVGEALLYGVELSTPCDRPDKLAGKRGFEVSFQLRGGLNCQILQSGIIKENDDIVIPP